MNRKKGSKSCDVLVLGAGPGGYTAAIRAGQAGLKVVIVEGEKAGGTCLNVGCIPSKALIHAAAQFQKVKGCEQDNVFGISLGGGSVEIDLSKTIGWKDGIVERLNKGVEGLLKKAGVEQIIGWGRMLDGKTCEVSGKDGPVLIHAEHVILATGSVASALPSLPFGGKVISSTEALALTHVPDKLVVVGGGYIGLELGTAFAKFGSEVHVVEFADHILPHYDREIGKVVLQSLKSLGVTVTIGAAAKQLSEDGSGLVVGLKDGSEVTLPADKILVTVGRKPRLEGWGADNLYLTMRDGFIAINDKCQTSMTDIYAIGDVTGEPMLAHRAIAQGELVADILAGKPRRFDPAAIPAICFTDPEVVSAGLSPDEAEAAGYEIVIGQFPFAANGKAMASVAESGFVRVVARKDNHLVLGIQAVGKGVAELAASFGLALEMGARLEDIAGTIHAHPTQGEGLLEAAFGALGHPLHM
ncbi:dihydrolipoyl dehydrogenase [Cohaesibacter intestini]|uniref:dihydrolipoyl dehydrogenase n=1 Tax=Cohaesibacter intestini TaxID=2211145 RepID=UPI000DEA29E9|nr:dihydrolipoyl dehydrogenase [Cohaesibacter intestini]